MTAPFLTSPRTTGTCSRADPIADRRELQDMAKCDFYGVGYTAIKTFSPVVLTRHIAL
jgi:hypothetical protein